MANTQHDHEVAQPHYALTYGIRLDNGTAPELAHPHVQMRLPDGSEGSMALHVINGPPDEIKRGYQKAWMPFLRFVPKSSHTSLDDGSAARVLKRL